MGKRAQVTIFIILAIVVVAAVGIYFLASGTLDKIKGSSLDTRQIESFVQSCIEETGKDAIYFVGQGGGYTSISNRPSVEGIPYYFYEGRNHMPSNNKIEQEISEYVSGGVYFCVNNFEDFPNYNITSGQINTQTRIEANEVILNVEYPLTIKKEDSTSVLKNWEDISIKSNLGIIYGTIIQIIENQLKRESVCVSCILDVSLQTDLVIELINYDEETTLFFIKDNEVGLNNEPFEYIFAIKLENEEE